MLEVDVPALLATGPRLQHAAAALRDAGDAAEHALRLAAGELPAGQATDALGALLSATGTAHRLTDAAVQVLSGVASAGRAYADTDQRLARRGLAG